MTNIYPELYPSSKPEHSRPSPFSRAFDAVLGLGVRFFDRVIDAGNMPPVPLPPRIEPVASQPAERGLIFLNGYMSAEGVAIDAAEPETVEG